MYSGVTSVFDVFRKSSVRFKFLREEEVSAKAWLERRGWKEGEKFVCLFVRDSAYLAKDKLHSSVSSKRWDYHNYRDSNIDTYADAVQALLDKGYWVIRMGKNVNKRLSVINHKLIDYPFVDDRDDLLDIWLTINCHFLISTATGLDVIPLIYEKPSTVFVNALPLLNCATSIRHLWVPKHLRWKQGGELLTLKEHCNHAYGLADEYEQKGISIQDLSSEEITFAVMECEQRLEETWVETEDARDRQLRYWEVFQSTPSFSKYHDYIHPEARVGSAWLKSMRDEFFE
jgi:putative glycosyltransferase (TIGR04372 family)